MNLDDLFPEPKRDDEKNAQRWRGSLFWKYDAPIQWKDKYYKTIEPPNSVTFPICEACRHVIWEWPHFEEAVPERAMCGECAREEIASQERDAGRE